MAQRKTSSKVPAFMGTAHAKSPQGAGLAVFGANHGTPYRGINNRIHEGSADAYRRALASDADWVNHWDFDLDGPLLTRSGFKAVDLGNLPTRSQDGPGNRKKIEAMTRSIVEAGAVPIMFGGDDSVPIPFLAGFSQARPITVLQIDAHIDWRDSREGERMGFSSTMRRASEMAHVWRIVQAGARGLGSAREEELLAAQSWGARIITSRTIHRDGIEPVIAQIEPGSDCVISLDLDALDACVMPAVAYPSPGGLTFNQVTDLFDAVAAKARLAGLAMVEFVPKKDRNDVAAYTAGRIAARLIGLVARAQAGRA